MGMFTRTELKMELLVTCENDNELQYFGSMDEAISCLKAQDQFSSGILSIQIEGSSTKFRVTKEILVRYLVGIKVTETRLLLSGGV